MTKEQQIQSLYASIPVETREDLFKALSWATHALFLKEGAGHQFQIIPMAGESAACQCEFAKPEWSGSHVGRDMPLGSEAIVMAVCEYLCGA